MSGSEAVGRIHDRLSDHGAFGHNRNEHLHEIADLLKGLDRSELNRTLNGLSRDDLERLGDDLEHGGFGGMQGLSESERKDLFNDLARDAGGAELARLSEALEGRGDVEALGRSVADYATPQAKVEYIEALAARTTNNDSDTHTGFGSSTSTYGSPEAVAVGNVLASLRGANFDAAVGKLDAAQLDAVVRAASRETLTTTVSPGGAASSVSHDTAPLAAILDAAATGGDPAVKSRLFRAGAGVLGGLDGSLFTPDVTASTERPRLADALTRLLQSDTTGVVDRLATDELSGRSLAAYAKAMVKEGRIESLGQLMAKLQHGNDLSEPDAAKYISQTRTNSMGQEYYANAQSLGYFSGAVQAGINTIISDRKAQADAIGNLFTSALFAASAAVPGAHVGVKVAVPLINGATRQTITEISNGYARGDRDLRDSFNELALPRLGDSGERYRGPAEADFLSYQNTVWLQNQ